MDSGSVQAAKKESRQRLAAIRAETTGWSPSAPVEEKPGPSRMYEILNRIGYAAGIVLNSLLTAIALYLISRPDKKDDEDRPLM